VKRYDGFAWKGYTLDAKRSPIFRYTWNGADVEESYAATGDGNKPDGKPTLIRTVKISGKVPANAWFRIATGQLEAKDGSFLLKAAKGCRITTNGGRIAGQNLVIPAKPGTLSITYQWAQ
jgi:hypothetical protein